MQPHALAAVCLFPVQVRLDSDVPSARMERTGRFYFLEEIQ